MIVEGSGKEGEGGDDGEDGEDGDEESREGRKMHWCFSSIIKVSAEHDEQDTPCSRNEDDLTDAGLETVTNCCPSSSLDSDPQ